MLLIMIAIIKAVAVYAILAFSTTAAFLVIAVPAFRSGRHEVSALFLAISYGVTMTIFAVRWMF